MHHPSICELAASIPTNQAEQKKNNKKKRNSKTETFDWEPINVYTLLLTFTGENGNT